MQMTFRWYGPADPVPLAHIRQIPRMQGIVSALYDVAPGVEWTQAMLAPVKDEIEAAGLAFAVVESLNVHEDVKLGRPTRDLYIERYGRSLEAIGALGIPVVCYNFMPVFDWTRTDLAMPLPDGATALAYHHDAQARIEQALLTGGLPGWAATHTPAELDALRAAYAEIGEEGLWENLAYFLERVAPVAESAGVKLAIHPDDPPWPVFGLPRIVDSPAAMLRVLSLMDSPANGLTVCTGSLGADPANDLPGLVRQAGARIHFAHLRNVRVTAPRHFHETSHPEGDVDLAAVVRALVEAGFDGPVRPDHGRMIWGEGETPGARPGYGLYDRALGAAYLLGLWDATPRPASPPRP
jgi:mannonate dehydratase